VIHKGNFVGYILGFMIVLPVMVLLAKFLPLGVLIGTICGLAGYIGGAFITWLMMRTNKYDYP
jgi:hypothetical protein